MCDAGEEGMASKAERLEGCEYMPMEHGDEAYESCCVEAVQCGQSRASTEHMYSSNVPESCSQVRRQLSVPGHVARSGLQCARTASMQSWRIVQPRPVDGARP